MELATTRFGTVTVDDAAVITFTQPIIGFQNFRRFVILPGPAGSRVQWLQSVDSGELAFILMNPRDVVPDYTIDLPPHELTELAVKSAEELEVYTLVVVPANPAEARTNLKAPILINPGQRLGKQTILERSTYPIRYALAQAKGDGEVPQEASNARTHP
jgi:flagellar assembly factor FliW